MINDPDGYTNVRARPDKSAPLVDKVNDGEQFTVLKQAGNWCQVETQNGKTGYMHQSRVRFLTQGQPHPTGNDANSIITNSGPTGSGF